MITLIGNALYQWDTERKVKVIGDRIKKVSFCNDHYCDSNVVDVVDGVAVIPYVLLQSAQKMDVYGIDENGDAIYSCEFTINSKAKPKEYDLPIEGGGSGGGGVTMEEVQAYIDKVILGGAW